MIGRDSSPSGSTSNKKRSETDKDSVLGFIRGRFPTDCHWLDGNCYYFALILADRFPKGKIVYDVIDGHFACEIGGLMYDWSGVVKESGLHKWVEWDKFIEYDSLQFERVVKDCTL